MKSLKTIYVLVLLMVVWTIFPNLSFAGVVVAEGAHESGWMNEVVLGGAFIGVGLLVNKGVLSAIFINLKTTFNKAFEETESTWEKIAMLVPSTGSQNDYGWLSRFPKMRKWIGEKVIKALKAYKYTVVNDDWEATVEVDRNDIDDDSLGIYAPQAKMAGWSAKMLPEEIVEELVNGVFINKCFDGQYFCDTDHPVGDGVVSNKLTAKLSIATLAAAQGSYGAAKTAIRKFKDDDGRSLKTKSSILLVGAALEDTANALMKNDRLEDGKPNIYKGTAEVVVMAGITNDNFWAVLDASKPIKPFVYQERKAPVFVEMTDPQSELVFKQKKFLFGAEARAAGGYAFWQLCVASDGSV